MDPNVYKQLMQLFAPQAGNGFSMNGPVAPQGPVPQGESGGGYNIMEQLGGTDEGGWTPPWESIPPVQSPITSSPTVQSTSEPVDPFANFSGMDSWNMDRISSGEPWWAYGNAGDINQTEKDLRDKILTEGEAGAPTRHEGFSQDWAMNYAYERYLDTLDWKTLNTMRNNVEKGSPEWTQIQDAIRRVMGGKRPNDGGNSSSAGGGSSSSGMDGMGGGDASAGGTG